MLVTVERKTIEFEEIIPCVFHLSIVNIYIYIYIYKSQSNILN